MTIILSSKYYNFLVKSNFTLMMIGNSYQIQLTVEENVGQRGLPNLSVSVGKCE